ncbi:MAG: hypothetical protein ABJ360_28350 [Roseobacter sp.]
MQKTRKSKGLAGRTQPVAVLLSATVLEIQNTHVLPIVSQLVIGLGVWFSEASVKYHLTKNAFRDEPLDFFGRAERNTWGNPALNVAGV